jgi:hypothetical protein
MLPMLLPQLVHETHPLRMCSNRESEKRLIILV